MKYRTGMQQQTVALDTSFDPCLGELASEVLREQRAVIGWDAAASDETHGRVETRRRKTAREAAHRVLDEAWERYESRHHAVFGW